jgi:FlgN protein
MARSSLAELARLLASQETAMEELASALAEEERCIAGMDLVALDLNRCRKEAAIAGLIPLKGDCIDLIARIGAERGVKETGCLSQLMAVLSVAEQEELRPLQQRLIRRAVALEGQFDSNRGMLEGSLALVRGSMALFGRLLGGCDTYGAGGNVVSGRVWGSILHKEM